MFPYYINELVPSGLSWLWGFLTTLLIYVVFKRYKNYKPGFINYSGIRILLTDFWFDGFLIRKIISVTYFLALVIFNSVIWNEIINHKETYYLGPLGPWVKYLFLIMFLIGVRILLELSVAVIKISENTTVIREYLMNMNEPYEFVRRGYPTEMSNEKILEEDKEDETPVSELKSNDFNIPR